MPQSRLDSGSTIYTFHEYHHTSHTVTQTVMSSSSFLNPANTCNGSGGLMTPGGGGGDGGGGGGMLTVGGGGGGGNLYAAIGRRPTPMLARKNTPTESEVKASSKNATESLSGNKSKITTTTSSSSSSSTVLKLPAISTTPNTLTQGHVRPNKVEVQPVGKTHMQDINMKNNNDISKAAKMKKKNVSFGESHVVDDSWITDKWCKRGLSINAIRNSLRKRFRRNRNIVSSDKQCVPEEPELEAEQTLPPKKPPVQLAPILKTSKSPNPPVSPGSNPEFTTTMNSLLHNTNANLR